MPLTRPTGTQLRHHCQTHRLLSASHAPYREAATASLPDTPPAQCLSHSLPGHSYGITARHTACSVPLTRPTGKQLRHHCRTHRLLSASHAPYREAATASLPDTPPAQRLSHSLPGHSYGITAVHTAFSVPLTRPTGTQLRHHCRTHRLLSASHAPYRDTATASLPDTPPAQRLSRALPGHSYGITAGHTACSVPLTRPTGTQLRHHCRTHRLLNASHALYRDTSTASLPDTPPAQCLSRALSGHIYGITAGHTACSVPLTHPTGTQLRHHCRTHRLLSASHSPYRDTATASLPDTPPAQRLSRALPGHSYDKGSYTQWVRERERPPRCES